MCSGIYCVVGSLNDDLGETSNGTGDDNCTCNFWWDQIFSDAVQCDPMSGPDLCDAAKDAGNLRY